MNRDRSSANHRARFGTTHAVRTLPPGFRHGPPRPTIAFGMAAADDESAATLDDALGPAPALLDSAAGRRQRDEIRARLFDTAIDPEHIGRYEVIRRLGAGAVGVVYLARDARLDRELAIKVMRERGGDAARLRREAQTMARLSHPNVAAIYEVGEHDGRVFVAMELVPGQTLRTWQSGRSWREVLDAYLQAGRGLAAAHRAGIVHRDFKPDNVMITPPSGDGEARVRVLDFGLARGDASEPETPGWLDPELGALATTLTGTGTTLGTPAYMPPEQLRSAAVDARADQFAFCVSVFEGCYGVRPFLGDTVRALYEAALAGRVRDVPRDRDVPRRVRAVLLRGLAADPGQRFVDLDALLTALARVRARPTRIAIASGALAVTALAGALALQRTDACASAGAALDDTWTGDHADALRRRARAETSDAQPWLTRVDELVRGAASWRAEAVALCRDPQLEAAELRRTCLGDVRTAIANAEAGLVLALDRGAARPDARGLLGLQECASARRRGSLPALGAPQHEDAIAAIHAAMEATIDAVHAADYAKADATIAPALAHARELGEPALLAECLLLAAAVAHQKGELVRSEHDIEEAWDVARAAGADRLALRAATEAVDLVGHDQRRHDDGERWARAGDAIAARLPEWDQPRLHFLVNRGLMRLTFGDRDAAYDDLEEARLGYIAIDGPESQDLVPVLGNLAHIEILRREPSKALALLEASIAIAEAAHGHAHPELITSLVNESLVLIALERRPDAIAVLERARAIARTHGLTVEDAWIESDFAEVYWEEGRFADAHVAALRGLEGLRVVHGEAHPLVLSARNRLARILVAQGEDAAAAELLHDVIARAEARGDSAIHMAEARATLVGIAVRAGAMDQATREMSHALALGEVDPCAGALALANVSTADVEVVGAPEGARDPMVESLRTIVSGSTRCSGLERAEIELAFARVLARAGQTGRECREAARHAIESWRARGNGWLARATEAERWLASLPDAPAKGPLP